MKAWLALWIMLLPLVCLAQPQGPDTLWFRTFGTPYNDFVSDVATLPNGNIVVTANLGTGNLITEGHLFCYRGDGERLWELSLADSVVDELSSVKPLPNSGAVFCGYAYRVSTGSNLVFGQVDSAGHLLLFRRYPEIRQYRAKGMCSATGGGYYVAVNGGFTPMQDAAVVKLDSSGDVIWHTEFGGPGWDDFESLCETPSGDIVATGFQYTMSSHAYRIYAAKLTANGDSVWSRAYEDWPDAEGQAIAASSTGGCVIVGNVGIWAGQFPDIITLWISDDGELERHRIIGTPYYDWSGDVAVTGNGTVLLCGALGDSAGALNMSLIALSAQGDSLWSYQYPRAGIEWAWCMDLQAGGLLLAGAAEDVSTQTLDAAILRLSMQFDASTQPKQFFARLYSLEAYPNPFNPTTEIRFDLPKAQHVKLRVFDVLGKEVAVLKDGMAQAGSHAVMLDGSELPSGVYFARLEAGTAVKVQKMVLLK